MTSFARRLSRLFYWAFGRRFPRRSPWLRFARVPETFFYLASHLLARRPSTRRRPDRARRSRPRTHRRGPCTSGVRARARHLLTLSHTPASSLVALPSHHGGRPVCPQRVEAYLASPTGLLVVVIGHVDAPDSAVARVGPAGSHAPRREHDTRTTMPTRPTRATPTPMGMATITFNSHCPGPPPPPPWGVRNIHRVRPRRPSTPALPILHRSGIAERSSPHPGALASLSCSPPSLAQAVLGLFRSSSSASVFASVLVSSAGWPSAWGRPCCVASGGRCMSWLQMAAAGDRRRRPLS